MAAKHVGVKLPEDLVNVLKEGKTVAVLATFLKKGSSYNAYSMYLS